MATIYLDLIGGNDSADGSSFANRVLTFARAAALAQAGDTVRIKESTGPRAMTKNATWVNGGNHVTLSGAVNATICDCETIWTAAANVTPTVSTSRKAGTGSASLVIASAFTTGKIAYFPLGSVVDFSAYEQVTLWIKAATLPAGLLQLKLCSDATGDVAVNTLSIPATQTSVWLPIVLDNASALGNAVRSIALYAVSDPGAVTIILDQIVACKAAGNADELTFRTLIGKPNSSGAGGDDSQAWYQIRSIDGATITLETALSSEPTISICATANSSETVPAHTFSPTYYSIASNNNAIWLGNPVSPVTISGGWAAADMATQTGHTIAALLQTAMLTWLGGTFHVERLGFANIYSIDMRGVDCDINTQIIAANTVVLAGRNMTVNLICQASSLAEFGGAGATVIVLLSGATLTAQAGASVTCGAGSVFEGFNRSLTTYAATAGGVSYGAATGGAGGGGLDAAGVRAAVGLAAANLDTQLAGIATDAETAAEGSSPTVIVSATAVAATALSVTGRLSIVRNSQSAFQLTGLGSLAGRTSLIFAIKEDKEDHDDEAVVLIREGVGAEVVQGDDDVDPALGSLTVDDEDAGDVTIVLTAELTGLLTVRDAMFYAVKMDDQELTDSTNTAVRADVIHGVIEEIP